MLPDADGTWYYFDLVPEETEVRTGSPIYTGKVCVIGSNLKEDRVKESIRGLRDECAVSGMCRTRYERMPVAVRALNSYDYRK